ncbi:MAG: hypothetical protein RJB03_408 [Bacteroidota bacterium]|jgi:hypothetical protein
MLKADTIQKELKLISEAVADLPNTTPFSVPDHYFDGLTSRILQNIGQMDAEEEKDTILSTLLQSLQKENPYQVPAAYFQQLSMELNREKSTPVVQIFAWKKIIGFAAAACLAGILFLAFFFEKDAATPTLPVAQKTDWESQPLSTESIQTYLMESDQLQPAEITDPEVSSGNNLLVDLTPTMISEILKEIPENDISSYMAQTGGNEMVTIN